MIGGLITAIIVFTLPDPVPQTTTATVSNALATGKSINPARIPIGDGKVASAPQKGYIFSCQNSFGGGGSHTDGPWINGSTWDSTKKVQVEGQVEWANATFQINLEGAVRKITGNGLPAHTSGIYPIAADSEAYKYDRNPNSIQVQKIVFNLPANPTENSAAGCLPMGIIGIAKSGVAIFNGLDALGRDAAAHETLDACGGHPERRGTYHYHNLSSCLKTDSQPLGYALDGFGIYGLVENGQEITNQDLDECHGHKHSLEWDGKKMELYHYHMTREYPYSLGCYKGKAEPKPPGL